MTDMKDILSDDDLPEVDDEKVVDEVVDEKEVPEEPEKAAAEAEPEPEPQKDTTVPLGALQEERARRQALEDRLNALERSQATADAPAPPDIYENPEGYQRAIDQRLAQMEANANATMSERIARMQHGDQTIDEAFSAAQAAGVIDQFKGARDPWGDLAKWHKTQQISQEIGGDLEAYKKRVEEQVRAEIQAGLVAESVKAKAGAHAPSLAVEPNLGSRQNSRNQLNENVSMSEILGE